MENIGLVLEGGGMRGAYTAGALVWLIENNIMFNYGVGISSGAMHICSYYKKDIKLLEEISCKYMADKRNVGIIPLLKERRYVGYDYMFEYRVYAFYGDLSQSSDTVSYTFKHQLPTIVTQPQITSVSPPSGVQTTITWSAVQVNNQGSYQIQYQYFVGPSSAYSESYHVGTTSGLTATITENMIKQKCGTNFKGTCYLFVRAYWTNADGSSVGGWSLSSSVAFQYTPHNTVGYFNGSSWIECIVYYYNGTTWTECVPYRFDGTTWIECSL